MWTPPFSVPIAQPDVATGNADAVTVGCGLAFREMAEALAVFDLPGPAAAATELAEMAATTATAKTLKIAENRGMPPPGSAERHERSVADKDAGDHTPLEVWQNRNK
jgi:hypothetical protein